MKSIAKIILTLTLAILPVLSARAQASADSASPVSNEGSSQSGYAAPATAQPKAHNDIIGGLSVYVNGGFGGFQGFRGVEDDMTSHGLKPNVSIGVNYSISDALRAGINIGVTQLATLNTSIKTVSFTDNNYLMESGKVGTLEKIVSDIIDRNDEAIVFLAATVDYNPLAAVSDLFGVWVGTGLGYMSVWNHSILTQAVSEEAIAQGADYFNVESHDYIKTTSSDSINNAMFIPVTVSAEYALTDNLALSAGAKCFVLPLDVANTPTSLWETVFGVRINF